MAAESSKDYCSPQILGRCWTERRSRHKDTVSHLLKELVHLPSVSILNAWSGWLLYISNHLHHVDKFIQYLFCSICIIDNFQTFIPLCPFSKHSCVLYTLDHYLPQFV